MTIKNTLLALLVAVLALLVVPGGAGAQDSSFDLDYTPADAKLNAAIDELEPYAYDRWPDTYGGAWIDDKGPEGGIYVAFTRDSKESVAELSKDFPQPELLEPVKVDDTLRELETAQERLSDDMDKAVAGEGSVPYASEPEMASGLDVARNEMVVYPESGAASLGEGLETAYGVDVRAELALTDVEEYACSNRYNCSPLRGGISYQSGGNACTMGFTVRRGNGNKQVLSAGHCGSSGNAAYQSTNYAGSRRFGTVKQSQNGGKIDALRASIDTNGYSGRGWVYHSDSQQGRQVSGDASWRSLLTGQAVTASARNTNTTSGQVKDKYYDPGVGYDNRFVASTVAGLPGDSGGALYKSGNTQAVGVLRGPHRNNSWIIHSHIEFIKSSLGVSVVQN